MLFAIGFLVTFLLGGLTGVMLASAPLDFQLHDSYFVVAHMHYVLFGGSVFALFAGIYYWFPKFTGRCLHEGWGRLHFALMFVGLPPDVLRAAHARRSRACPGGWPTTCRSDGFTTLNRISTVGAFLLGASTLPFLWNVWRTLRAASRPATTRGAATPSSGRRRRRRRRTTSTARCRRSARTGRCGTCTTPTAHGRGSTGERRA